MPSLVERPCSLAANVAVLVFIAASGIAVIVGAVYKEENGRMNQNVRACRIDVNADVGSGWV